MKYRREIDGLRALAVIPVILFHAGFGAFSGGYVGVDIFFVISGYLITTILVTDLQADNFSLVDFYERRTRRILPGLFFVVLTTVPLAWILLPPSELVSFSKSVSAVSLFISNFFFWRDGGYFITAAELKPLVHTWSLAVEEQYYIFFPVFLMLFWRFGRKTVLWVVIFLAAISLTIAQIGSVLNPIPNFLLLPSRAWELAVGAVAAFYLLEKNHHTVDTTIKQFFSLCGFSLILTSIFLYDRETPFPSVYALIPTGGAALIILFADKDTYVGRLLGARSLVGIGLISYSAYLWHQPILAFSRVGASLFGDVPKFALLSLIFGLSIFSWKFIESPFRKSHRFNTKLIFSFSIGISALFALVGFVSSRALIGVSNEPAMARDLSTSAAIYVSNMNERTFIKSRIEIETLAPRTIVLGSSRIMQIGSRTLGTELLNLGVSGSSVEDAVAIWKLASEKFDPDLLLVSADPWLFNAKSGQDRWLTLESAYYSELAELGVNPSWRMSDRFAINRKIK
jgi:peptidoglycan/LPS O-acetylase OafA/YrhL